ncbi:MAG: 50S ribosomal protein L3 [Desulfatitalea sp.]|nr:50S ribosomal protein L3 [Desulfatitalea sp.]NNK01186.1 50S ribosomal protein L3 [Desulfatitalea sp.]
MSKGLIGKKLGMTSMFTSEGQYLPVTVIQAGPCVVTQIKTQARDGYNALQLGFGDRKAVRTNKPLQGHFNKSGDQCFSHLREVEVDTPDAFSLGQNIGSDLFKVGERVDIIGKTKGRGFSGVMRRHGFGGGRKTHGGKCHRIPGSIGCSAWPSKVFKGKRLPGRYGVDQKTIRNLEIVDVRPEENLILVKGAVPGHRQAVVMIKKLKFAKAE